MSRLKPAVLLHMLQAAPTRAVGHRGTTLLDWVTTLRERGDACPLLPLQVDNMRLGECSAEQLHALTQHPLAAELPALLQAIESRQYRNSSWRTRRKTPTAPSQRFAGPSTTGPPRALRASCARPRFPSAACAAGAWSATPRGNGAGENTHVSVYLCWPAVCACSPGCTHLSLVEPQTYDENAGSQFFDASCTMGCDKFHSRTELTKASGFAVGCTPRCCRLTGPIRESPARAAGNGALFSCCMLCFAWGNP